MKLKILHPLLCYFPSQAGGPANTIYWINNSLNTSGFSSEIVSTKFGLNENIGTIVNKENHKTTFLNSSGKQFIYKCNQELKSSDIIQFSSLFFPPTLPLIISAVFKKKTIVLSPRGELYEAALSQKSLKKKIWISIFRFFQNKINFHATNTFELQAIKKHFPKAKSYIVIPNFIELPEKLNKEIEMKVVFLGRINPIKNIHLLIDAIKIVHDQYPNIKLEILGSVRFDYEKKYLLTLHDRIKKLSLEKEISFQGHLDGERKNEIIASSKVLVLPSQSENFGNVVLEALAQGTPVVASKNTPWQLLEESQAGFWCEGNSKEIAKNILKILNLNEKEYTSMRENAFKLCKTQFDIKSNIQIWENYYQKTTTYVQK